MLSLFNEFQHQMKEGKIKATNNNFNELLLNLNFNLVFKNNIINEAIQILNIYITETKLFVIDFTQVENDYFFVICFDKKIIIIEASKLSLLQTFLFANKDSSFYFLKKSKEMFQNHLKFEIIHSFDENPAFAFELDSFNFDIQKINSARVISFWKIVKRAISGYLIQKSYRNFSKNRIKDILLDNNKSIKCTISKRKDFIFLRNLGNSVNAQLCYSIKDEQLYVIKISNNDFESEKLQKRELNNYQKISHPFLPQYFGVFDDEMTDTNSIIIEYIVGKSLDELKELNDQMKLKIIFQLLIVIEYLHNNHFIYRDLKPNNVILDKNGTTVLIDFDRMISYDEINNRQNMLTSNFPSICSAPEFNFSKASYASDIYSIGILIYYIITGKNPRQDLNGYIPIKNHFDDFPQKFSKLKVLCEKCTSYNPDERPTISELIDTFYIDFYSKIHIHGLKITDNEYYLQDFSEIKTIQSTPNLHSIDFYQY